MNDSEDGLLGVPREPVLATSADDVDPYDSDESFDASIDASPGTMTVRATRIRLAVEEYWVAIDASAEAMTDKAVRMRLMVEMCWPTLMTHLADCGGAPTLTEVGEAIRGWHLEGGVLVPDTASPSCTAIAPSNLSRALGIAQSYGIEIPPWLDGTLVHHIAEWRPSLLSIGISQRRTRLLISSRWC